MNQEYEMVVVAVEELEAFGFYSFVLIEFDTQ